MKRLLFFCFLLLLIFVSKAQENELLKLEFEITDQQELYRVANIDTSGLIVFAQTEQRDNQGNIKWIFMRYSGLMKQLWKKEYAIDRSMNYQNYFYDGQNQIYFLLENYYGFQLLEIDLLTGNMFTKNIPYLDSYNPLFFKVIGKRLFIAGQSKPNFSESLIQFFYSFTLIPLFTGHKIYNQVPVLQTHDLQSGKNQFMMLDKGKKSNLIGSHVSNNQALNFIVRKLPRRKILQVQNCIIDSAGNTNNILEIKTEIDKDLIAARLLELNEKETVVTGMYSKVNPKKKKSFSLPNAHGIYFSRFSENNQFITKYYDLSRLSYFTNEIKSKSGFFNNKTNIYESNYLIHEPVKHNNEIVFLAEAYYPQYHSETYTTFVNGRPVLSTRNVFDGYRYTHALLASFDLQGELLWDNYFEMNDVLSFDLEKRVNMLLQGDEVALIYVNEGKLKTKIIKGSRVIESKSENDLDENATKNNQISYQGGNILPWYKNYFIAYGLKTVKKDQTGIFGQKKTEQYFYLTKIAYQ